MVKYSKKRTKSFVRDGSVQHFKIGGGKQKRRLKLKSLKKYKRHSNNKK